MCLWSALTVGWLLRRQIACSVQVAAVGAEHVGGCSCCSCTVCASIVHASAVVSQSLLVGTGNLTRRGRATDALPYRDAVAQRLELHEPSFGREAQPVITLLDKEASGWPPCDVSACISMRRRVFRCVGMPLSALLTDQAELASEPNALHVLSQLAFVHRYINRRAGASSKTWMRWRQCCGGATPLPACRLCPLGSTPT